MRACSTVCWRVWTHLVVQPCAWTQPSHVEPRDAYVCVFCEHVGHLAALCQQRMVDRSLLLGGEGGADDVVRGHRRCRAGCVCIEDT